MRPDVAFSYVRDLLERMTGVRPTQDDDGDLPFLLDGAQFYVRILGAATSWVQVFSIALDDVEPSPELMHELNGINARLRFARAFHMGGQVLIETEIWSDDVNPSNFHYACGNVAGATDEFARPLQEAFGGRLAFEQSKTDDYGQSPLHVGFAAGPYL